MQPNISYSTVVTTPIIYRTSHCVGVHVRNKHPFRASARVINTLRPFYLLLCLAPSALAMPLSSLAKHRFQNSLDLAAARAMWGSGCIPQSGTGNFWAVEDSPTLGYMLGAPSQSSDEAGTTQGSRLGAPAYVKKLRRRGLSEGMHLTLPPSPLPPGSPAVTPPPMSSSILLSSSPGHHSPEQSRSATLAFTAEWDCVHATFIFTPIESAPPSGLLLARSGSVASCDGPRAQRSVPSTPSTGTPWPTSPPMTSPALVPSVPRPPSHGHPRSALIVGSEVESTTPEPSSASDSPMSALFDVQAASHMRKGSQSTAASSAVDLAFLLDSERSGPEEHVKQDASLALDEIFARPSTQRQSDTYLVPPWVKDNSSSTMRCAAESSASSIYSIDSISSRSSSHAKSISLRRQITKALSATLFSRR